MRILHILDHSLPKHSGYVFRTMSIVEQQKALGWEPILFTTPRHGPSMESEETIGKWSFLRTPNSGTHQNLPKAIKEWQEMRITAQHLRKVIPAIAPDIVHAHSPVLNFFPAKLAAKNIPVVYEVRAFWEDAAVDHGTTQEKSLRYKISRALETRAFKRATAITTICEGLRRDIVARGINSEKVTVIPNAVDVAKFPPITARHKKLEEKLGLRGKSTIGFIGSFYAYEGLLFLVKALPALLKRKPDIRLLLVGGGPEETALKETVAALNLENHVIFTGRVPHESVRDYYSLADIMVYPRHSIRLTETVTPLKPLEAMAMKKLVLASDIGGHRELITDGETGKLFIADNADSLIDSCCELIENKKTWPAYLNAGRDYVENVRNWGNSVSNYRHVYETCLKSIKD